MGLLLSSMSDRLQFLPYAGQSYRSVRMTFVRLLHMPALKRMAVGLDRIHCRALLCFRSLIVDGYGHAAS
jgi:hypothetical protein